MRRRRLFVDVVRQAQAGGLVKGKRLTVDATTVKANASLESLHCAYARVYIWVTLEV